MTNEEEALRKVELICDMNKNSDWSTCIGNQCEDCHWNTIKKALNKQIAEKPAYIKESKIYVITFDWQCPNCKREYANCRYTITHCPDCGQKLDWSEKK